MSKHPSSDGEKFYVDETFIRNMLVLFKLKCRISIKLKLSKLLFFLTLSNLFFIPGHTAGVTDQQRMITPPGNLILLLIFFEVHICSAPDLYFPLDF